MSLAICLGMKIMKNEQMSKREPSLALTLSIILPGLGQVYNGDLAKGISLFVMAVIPPFLLIWLGFYAPEQLLFVFIVLGSLSWLFVYLLSIIDAWKRAKKIGKNYVLKPYNKFYIYLVIILFCHYFVFGNLMHTTRSDVFQTFKIAPRLSLGGLPNFLPGDYFIVDKRHRPGSEDVLRRGDVVTFVYPNDRTKVFFGRIIGLPKDEIKIKGTTLFVNGYEITGETVDDLGSQQLNKLLEDHIAYNEYGDRGAYHIIWKKDVVREDFDISIPNGHAFILGDNRDGYQDSRYYGCVPLVDITGKARQIFLSIDPDGGVRWTRIGKIVSAK